MHNNFKRDRSTELKEKELKFFSKQINTFDDDISNEDLKLSMNVFKDIIKVFAKYNLDIFNAFKITAALNDTLYYTILDTLDNEK